MATLTREQLAANARAIQSKIADANEKQAGFSYAPGMDRQKYIEQGVTGQLAQWERDPQFGGYANPNTHVVNGVTYQGPAQAATPSPAPVDGLKAISPENFPVLYGSQGTPTPPTQTEQVTKSATETQPQAPAAEPPHEDQVKPTQQPNNNISNVPNFSGNLWRQAGNNSQSLSRQQMQQMQMSGQALEGLKASRGGVIY